MQRWKKTKRTANTKKKGGGGNRNRKKKQREKNIINRKCKSPTETRDVRINNQEPDKKRQKK